MPLTAARSRFLKIGMTVVVGLVVVQYWLRGLPDMRHLEPLFFVNITRPPWKKPWMYENVTIDDGDALLYTPEGNTTQEGNSTTQLICPAVPPGLQGRITALKEAISMERVEIAFPQIEPGGSYRPSDCRARDRVAIIVPYRDREEHLAIFLYNIHRLLIRQQIDYGIFVIEQQGTGAFNRGKLMNIGFVEAKQQREYDCFVFHDVDLLPEDDRNLYTCPEQPRHMSVAVDKFKYKLPYKDLFGGVSALTRDHFEQVNGFSNSFWGWGGEDDDMSNRIKLAGLHIGRYPPYIARYAMLSHSKQAPNKDRFKLIQQGKKRHSAEGLNSLAYVRKEMQLRRLYTWILVDLQPPS